MLSINRLKWIGLALIVVAMLLNPGPPYQDATPELEAKYDAQVMRCGIFAGIGLALFLIGLISTWFVAAEEPKRTKRPSFFDRIYDRYLAE